MKLKGRIVVDQKTKNLIMRIKPGEIAIICHPDLDEIAAQGLVESKVKAVINAENSITGKYPSQGAALLLKAGIPLIDNAGLEIMELSDGQFVDVENGKISYLNKLIGKGSLMTSNKLESLLDRTKENTDKELYKFINNTLSYVTREKELILKDIEYPDVRTNFKGRHAVIVVRGQGYKEDLLAIRPFISEVKPILIAVDGGADALMDIGYKPDLIIGDMDSISDTALKYGGELIVHAYKDGKAPGTRRLDELGLKHLLFPAPGTSEDIAMLLAQKMGADLIVAVGTHSNMIDFLEKGRKGMASTFLVRLKVGPQLVDARGVSKLYQSRYSLKHLTHIFIAGLIPIFIIFATSPILNQFFKIIALKLRLFIRL